MPIRITDKPKCSGCHACYAICPKNCISMETDLEGFLYPTVDNRICVNCGLCESVCPIINYSAPAEDACGMTFAASHKNDEIRMKSSSGGVFTAIADSVIESGGVVFGAAFDNNFAVKTICVETKQELELLRGSKYVQSTIGDSYKKVKDFLTAGRIVLFSGTPCQIGGLYSFLNKNYKNLITVDFICHGVPSPLVWKKYLEFRKNNVSDIEKISFRHKNYGWKKFSVLFNFLNNTEYSETFDNDPYMRVFLDDYSLRPSCYNCSFKTADRKSDITVGDFWGVENIYPEIDDDKGLSIVVVHSQKGYEWFKRISSVISTKETKKEYCNYSYLKSANKPQYREYYFSVIKNYGFNEAFELLQNKINKNRLLKEIKKDLKKLRLRRVLRKIKEYFFGF